MTPQTDTTQPQLVPINIAARWLSVPIKWLRDEADAGRIPRLRAGKVILCDFAAVEAALLERGGVAGKASPERHLVRMEEHYHAGRNASDQVDPALREQPTPQRRRRGCRGQVDPGIWLPVTHRRR